METVGNILYYGLFYTVPAAVILSYCGKSRGYRVTWKGNKLF